MQESAIVNKYHWYDGGFYDRFIAPNQRDHFKQIIELIEPESNIIDVGCGTGFFSVSVADKCGSILGIDLSKRNIDKANKNLEKKPNAKLSFRNAYLHDIVSQNKNHFDYGVLTYVIHEVTEEDRIQLLNEIAQVADKIIIGDYLIPCPNDFAGKIVKTVEFIAGTEHYRNFRTYEANGGIQYLAEKAGLSILKEIKNHTNHIAVLSKNHV
ncbi:MAG: class I SAM-dependent methyltransferase [Paludibacter sp.]